MKDPAPSEVMRSRVFGKFTVYLLKDTHGINPSTTQTHYLYSVKVYNQDREIFTCSYISSTYTLSKYDGIVEKTGHVSSMSFEDLPLHVNDPYELTRLLVLERLKG